ncbi:DUF853 family protein [Candidatus Pacearchaeota archaeon]|nr:DUF853 family protein [Candidatus Pacearchaeota archaeon]
MAYQRYITIKGKRYGPYTYHSKRVRGKPKTIYIRKDKKEDIIETKDDVPQSTNKESLFSYLFLRIKALSNSGALANKALPFFAGLALGLIVLTIVFFSAGITGNASLQAGSDYTDGSPFDGTFHISTEINSESTEYLVLTNNEGFIMPVKISVDENISRYIFIEESVKIPPYSSVHVQLDIKPEGEGVFSGRLHLSSESENITVPLVLAVKSSKEQYLEITASAEKREVEQGEYLDFNIFISNLGQMTRYNAALSFDLLNARTNESVLQQGESVVVESSLSLSRRIQVPSGISSGEYIFDVSASYENITRHSLVPIHIGSRPSTIVLFVRDYFVLILLILFVITGTSVATYYFVFVRRKQFIKKMAELQKNSIYPFPDFDSLPQSKYAYVGIVADTEEKVFFDTAQLTRHTLIAGGTGSGKTVSGMVLVEELIKRGASVLVLDPVGQWTGFVKSNEDKIMREKYKKFGIKTGMAFQTRVLQIDDSCLNLDIIHYINQKGLTIVRLDGLTPAKADAFVESTLEQIYRAKLPETGGLRSLVVLDEVHRLLPKYGGRKAYTKLEQAVREFRKWGVGLLMISQVLTDFKGAIRGNIGTEIQMHSRYEGDIKRVRERHGADISKLISKMPVGIGMVEGAGINKGNPYFIEFRPLLHSPLKLSERDIQSLVKKEKAVVRTGSTPEQKDTSSPVEKKKPDPSKFIESLKKKKSKKRRSR